MVSIFYSHKSLVVIKIYVLETELLSDLILIHPHLQVGKLRSGYITNMNKVLSNYIFSRESHILFLKILVYT